MTRLTLLICMLALLCSCSKRPNVQHKQYASKQATVKAKQSTPDSAKLSVQTDAKHAESTSTTSTVATVSKASEHVDLHAFSKQVAARYAIGLRVYGDVSINRRSMQNFITVVCETNDLPVQTCMKLASDQFDKLAMQMLHVNTNEYAQIVAYTCDGQQCISRYKAIVDRKLAKELNGVQERIARDKAVQQALQEESAEDD